VVASLACPRVMAAPENIKAGFLKEKDVFAEHGVRYVAPLVSLGDSPLVPKQLYAGLCEVLPGLSLKETQHDVQAGYRALESSARIPVRRHAQRLRDARSATSLAFWCLRARITWTRASCIGFLSFA